LAHALLEGGIEIMELTLRTPAAVGALKRIIAEVPEMTAGIGTILTPEQAQDVKNAGAVFGVSPGLNPRVLAKSKEIGLPFAPGISTPSDIEAAIEQGCRLLKFFPAETNGGLKHLKSMAAPYMHLDLKFIPLGGLNQDNFASYLADPSVMAVGGSWIAKRDVIKAKDWKTITENARNATETTKKLRG
jgi:2-dehydro-3-deoxyphosphogluconate aldolase/(4S)-4-hydroxy-2-oxoglutarate aldolase